MFADTNCDQLPPSSVRDVASFNASEERCRSLTLQENSYQDFWCLLIFTLDLSETTDPLTGLASSPHLPGPLRQAGQRFPALKEILISTRFHPSFAIRAVHSGRECLWFWSWNSAVSEILYGLTALPLCLLFHTFNTCPQFTSQVWRVFGQALGTSTSQSSGYHPQANGQTERVSQDLKDTILPDPCSFLRENTLLTPPSAWPQVCRH